MKIPNNCYECPLQYNCDTGILFPDCPFYRPQSISLLEKIKRLFIKNKE